MWEPFNKRRQGRSLLLSFIILILSLASGGLFVALAASGTWTGAISNIWNEDGNWAPSNKYPSGTGQTAAFGFGPARTAVAISKANVTVGSISFLSDAGYTLSGIMNGSLVFDNRWNPANLISLAGGNTISAPIRLVSDLRVINDSSAPLVISGEISGSQNLTISGSGATVLSGNNTFSQGTSVNLSTLIFGSNAAAGTGNLRLTCSAPCTNPNPTVTLGNLGIPSLINNPVSIQVGHMNFSGPAPMIFTNSLVELFQDSVFTAESTTSFARLEDKSSCGYAISRQGNGTLNLNLTGETFTCKSITNQAGSGSFNLYGSGQVGQIAFNPGTGGGGIFVGDTLEVATGTLIRGVGKLGLTRSLTFRTGNTRMAFDLNGTLPGVSFDQVTAQGDVELNDAELVVNLGFTPPIETTFPIIQVSDLSTIHGIFRGLPDGSLLQVNGLSFVINYTPTRVVLRRTDVKMLEILGGNNQSTRVTSPFGTPLRVKVTNSNGSPVVGLRVNFLAPFIGASASFSQADMLTDGNGIAEVVATANTLAGPYQVSASVISQGVQPVSFNLTNLPNVVTFLRVTGFASPAVSGQPYPFSITAVDDYGNINTSYQGKIRFLSDDPNAVLPAPYAFSPGDGGTHDFIATLKDMGSHLIMAVDADNNTIFGLQANILVVSGTTAQLKVTGFPVIVTAGAVHNFTVQTQDNLGNLTYNYQGTVTFSSDDSRAILPGMTTFPGGTSQLVFSAAFQTPGVHYLRVSDAAQSAITGEQAGIVVQAGLPAKMSILSGSGQISALGTNFSQPLVVLVVDGVGNPLSGIPVTFLQPSSGASCTFLEGTSIVLTDSQGKAWLTPVANQIAGSYTVEAQSGGLTATFELGNVANRIFLPLVSSGG